MRNTLLAFLLLVMTTGCDNVMQRPRAGGLDGQIVVVTDSLSWAGPVGAAIQESLGGYIMTLPAPEPSFELVRMGIEDRGRFNDLQTLKNVVFVAPLSDSTSEAAFIRSAFSDDALRAISEGGGGVVGRDDPWRRLQKVYFVTADTPDDLVSTIRTSGPEMVDAFNEISRVRMTLDMFERGRQRNLEESLMANHGFAVNIQHDYVVAVDTTDFVWLRRTLSSDTWRSLFVHYIENGNPALLSEDWIVAQRDSIARRYITSNTGGWVVTDTRRPLETRSAEPAGRFGFETRGLWQMVGPDENGNVVQYGMGGPFVTYAFYDEGSRRVYLIDGMVFAPDFDKREFLRQLEVIAYTFRSAADESSNDESLAAGIR
jgi:hypothetical protein